MTKIVVFGSINLDLVAQVASLPQPGETLRAEGFAQAAGGKGANQALAARRAGAPVIMGGAVGQDDFARAALELLKGAEVDLSRVRQADTDSGIALIFVAADGENIITIVPGANGTVTAGDADKMLLDLTESDFVLLQLESPADAVARAIEVAKAAGATTVLNTAPIIPEAAELAQRVDYVITNETEFEAIAGTFDVDNPEPALRSYADAHGSNVILTMGSAGAVGVVNGDFVKAPSLKVEAIDTVGAGDTFCGYLAAGLAEGKSARAAMTLAAAAGSLACTKRGAQPAVPLRSEVDSALG